MYEDDWAYRQTEAKYDVTNPAAEVTTAGSQTHVTKTQFTMDGLGNRSQVQVTPWGGSAVTTTYAADVMNQYTAIGGVTRVHDNNGNTTDDGSQLYVYDYKNRLVEVKDKSTGTSKATYKYDALGRRVEKAVVGGVTTRYILDGQHVVEEYDGSGSWAACYIQSDRIDKPVAMDRADIADVDNDSNTIEVFRFHYHQQALGSTTELTDPTGAVVEWVTYDVYGKSAVRDRVGATVAASAIGNPFLFTGREWDLESEKYFYRARTYDPVAGRFLQSDPLGYVDGLGLHEYVRSRPVDYVDPFGLKGGLGGRLEGHAKDVENYERDQARHEYLKALREKVSEDRQERLSDEEFSAWKERTKQKIADREKRLRGDLRRLWKSFRALREEVAGHNNPDEGTFRGPELRGGPSTTMPDPVVPPEAEPGPEPEPEPEPEPDGGNALPGPVLKGPWHWPYYPNGDLPLRWPSLCYPGATGWEWVDGAGKVPWFPGHKKPRAEWPSPPGPRTDKLPPGHPHPTDGSPRR